MVRLARYQVREGGGRAPTTTHSTCLPSPSTSGRGEGVRSSTLRGGTVGGMGWGKGGKETTENISTFSYTREQ